VKKYISPEIELIKIYPEDVITASGEITVYNSYETGSDTVTFLADGEEVSVFANK